MEDKKLETGEEKFEEVVDALETAKIINKPLNKEQLSSIKEVLTNEINFDRTIINKPLDKEQLTSETPSEDQASFSTDEMTSRKR